MERCLIVVFLQLTTKLQSLYNERCIGAMKNSFLAALQDRAMHFGSEKSGLFINICAMLSNIRVEEKDVNAGQAITKVRAVSLQETGMEVGFNDGEAVREQIVANYFG